MHFLSFFALFAKKNLTNFNYHTPCFEHHTGLSEADSVN